MTTLRKPRNECRKCGHRVEVSTGPTTQNVLQLIDEAVAAHEKKCTNVPPHPSGGYAYWLRQNA